MEGPQEVDMSIELESAELNPALPDAVFVLEPPRGVEHISLD
jgi:outer membrane lipoprotein-sorting protein